jgi:hypothetical protein
MTHSSQVGVSASKNLPKAITSYCISSGCFVLKENCFIYFVGFAKVHLK